MNRFLVGDDGRAAHYRVRRNKYYVKKYEFGEQVLAKPGGGTNRALEPPRFHFATRVGYNDRSNKHIVVVKAVGPSRDSDIETTSRKRATERDCDTGHRGSARHDQPEGGHPERPQEGTQNEA